MCPITSRVRTVPLSYCWTGWVSASDSESYLKWMIDACRQWLFCEPGGRGWCFLKGTRWHDVNLYGAIGLLQKPTAARAMMRCHYVLSMLHLVLVTMCSSVSLTLLNIRVSVLHTVLQYKGSNSLCIADTAVTLFYKVVGIVAERDLKSELWVGCTGVLVVTSWRQRQSSGILIRPCSNISPWSFAGLINMWCMWCIFDECLKIRSTLIAHMVIWGRWSTQVSINTFQSNICHCLSLGFKL